MLLYFALAVCWQPSSDMHEEFNADMECGDLFL